MTITAPTTPPAKADRRPCCPLVIDPWLFQSFRVNDLRQLKAVDERTRVCEKGSWCRSRPHLHCPPYDGPGKDPAMAASVVPGPSSRGGRARAVQAIIVSSVMLTFLSYWRIAAIVLGRASSVPLGPPHSTQAVLSPR